MDFHLFPFDFQLCPVELESYGHTTSDIIFKWIGEKSMLAQEARKFCSITLLTCTAANSKETFQPMSSFVTS